MAIYTPRGLKVRIHPAEAFAMMGRLFPAISAFKVLLKTEEFHNRASTVAFAVGIASAVLYRDPIIVFCAVLATRLFVRIINPIGIFGVLLRLCRPFVIVHGLLAGYGILALIVGGICYAYGGWQTALAYFAATFIAEGISLQLGYLLQRMGILRYGYMVGSPEQYFVAAYLHYALSQGVYGDLPVDEDEINSNESRLSLMQLQAQWPAIFDRLEF